MKYKSKSLIGRMQGVSFFPRYCLISRFPWFLPECRTQLPLRQVYPDNLPDAFWELKPYYQCPGDNAFPNAGKPGPERKIVPIGFTDQQAGKRSGKG